MTGGYITTFRDNRRGDGGRDGRDARRACRRAGGRPARCSRCRREPVMEGRQYFSTSTSATATRVMIYESGAVQRTLPSGGHPAALCREPAPGRCRGTGRRLRSAPRSGRRRAIPGSRGDMGSAAGHHCPDLRADGQIPANAGVQGRRHGDPASRGRDCGASLGRRCLIRSTTGGSSKRPRRWPRTRASPRPTSSWRRR